MMKIKNTLQKCNRQQYDISLTYFYLGNFKMDFLVKLENFADILEQDQNSNTFLKRHLKCTYYNFTLGIQNSIYLKKIRIIFSHALLLLSS